MNRIEEKFRQLRKEGKKALIVYITAGDPNLSTTGKLVLALEKAGVDIIELGIPFSDPLADGPTIQAASQRALAKGVDLKKIFSLVKALRKKTQIPLVFMTYYNPVLQYGLEKFCRACKKTGVDGLIVPDLPFEEAGDLVKSARKNHLDCIFLVAPTSTGQRIRAIAQKSRGFIYYVSLTGVTGARRSLPEDITAHLRQLKRMTKKPLCVGFGISTPAQAKMIARMADGIIVGSAVIKQIEKNLGSKDLIARVGAFVKTLRQAI
jgi:tryptophan synthase alpha chain